ncbi:MAG: biotin transporter BioY [Candidatus Omnitrophica bacterium]|nr:biotin transporter BioY [Candidatus Omnitrophota bacterium]
MKVSVKAYKLNPVLECSLVISFSLLMAVSSRIKMPLLFSPVPITFQTLVLFLSFVFLREKAVFSQALYIALGVLGCPVFSGGAGFLYLFGPTGGYIAGFFLSALIFPLFFRRFKGKSLSFIVLFLGFFLADLCIHFLGITWLRFLLKVSLKEAVVIGVFPFMVGELFKILAAAGISSKFLKTVYK